MTGGRRSTAGLLDALAATARERLAVCDLLASLTPEEWSTASLCEGWTVRDVAAHLTTSTRTHLGHVVVGMIRSLGDFDRMERDRAQRLVERHQPQELVAMIRATAGSSTRAPGADLLDPLARHHRPRSGRRPTARA